MSKTASKYTKNSKELETECIRVIKGMLNSELRKLVTYLKENYLRR